MLMQLIVAVTDTAPTGSINIIPDFIIYINHFNKK